jgi:hypothetical protein
MKTYFFTKWASSGYPITGAGCAHNGEVPLGAIACTEAQYNNINGYAIDTATLAVVTAPSSALLAQAKTQQNALLTTACAKAITGGFLSSALGTANTYPSTLTDQHNLSGSVIASLIPNLPSTWTTKFWVMDSSGAWTFAAHTAAQIQQAGLDGKAWVTAQQENLDSLKAQVAAATTVTVVQAVVWS